jgi:hypothetical protein
MRLKDILMVMLFAGIASCVMILAAERIAVNVMQQVLSLFF